MGNINTIEERKNVSNYLVSKTLQFLYWTPETSGYNDVTVLQHMTIRVMESPYDIVFCCKGLRRFDGKGKPVHSKLYLHELASNREYVKNYGGGQIVDVIYRDYKVPGMLWGSYDVIDMSVCLDDGSILEFENVLLNPKTTSVKQDSGWEY